MVIRKNALAIEMTPTMHDNQRQVHELHTIASASQ